MTTRTATGLWAPPKDIDPNDTVQRIGSALRAHWAAAKQVAASSPFFPPFGELARHFTPSGLAPHHFTMGGKLIR